MIKQKQIIIWKITKNLKNINLDILTIFQLLIVKIHQHKLILAINHQLLGKIIKKIKLTITKINQEVYQNKNV